MLSDNRLHTIITTWLDNDCADSVEQINEIEMKEYHKIIVMTTSRAGGFHVTKIRTTGSTGGLHSP